MALGGEPFKQEIAAALKRRVARLPPGPPPQAAKDKRGRFYSDPDLFPFGR
jgi:hypothetical protein